MSDNVVPHPQRRRNNNGHIPRDIAETMCREICGRRTRTGTSATQCARPSAWSSQKRPRDIARDIYPRGEARRILERKVKAAASPDFESDPLVSGA